MSLTDRAFDVLLKRWSATRPVCAGFRDDVTDVARWVAYCMNHRPVEYSLFLRMVTEEVPLPACSNEEALAAFRWLADQFPGEGIDVNRVARMLGHA